MPENRLEIIIGARDEEFRRALRRIDADAKKTGSSISDSFENSGDGIETLARVIDDVADSFDDASGDVTKDLGRIEKAAVQAGAKLDESFKGVDADKAAKQVEELEEALKKAGDAADELDEVADALEDVEGAAKSAGDSVEKALRTEAVGQFGAKLSEAGKDVGEFFEGAAEDARNLEREINKAFSDPAEVRQFSKIIGDLKAEFGELADSQGLIDATKTLKNFGLANEKELKKVINIAEATGKSYQEIAEKQGEFFAAAEGGTVNIQVLEEYRKTIGVGAKDLAQYGAVVDKNNKLVGKTPEQIALAQKALRTYLDTNERFTNVLERAQDGQDKLAARTAALNESIGVQVNEFKNAVAEGLLPFVDGLNNVSDGTKKAIGLSIAGGSAFAQYGGSALELAANAKLAGFSLQGARTAMLGAATAAKALAASTLGVAAGIAVAVAGLVVITKSIDDYNKSLQQAEQAEQSLLATQSRVIAQNKERISSINKSVEAIRAETDAIEDAGKRRATITQDIILKEAAANDARKAGEIDRAASLKADADALKRTRAEYDKQTADIVKGEEQRKKAVQDSFKAGEKAFDDFKSKLADGFFDSNAKALEELDSIAGSLQGEKLKEANSQRKKLREAALNDELAALKQEVTARKVTVDQAKVQLERLLSIYKSTGTKREKIEQDFTNVFKGELDKQFQAAENLAAQRLQLQQQSVNLRKQEGAAEIEVLRQRLSAGEDVQGLLEGELEKRNELLKSLADEEAALAKVAIQKEKALATRQDPTNAGEIAKIAAEKERQIDIVTSQKKAELDRKLFTQRAKLQQDSAKKALDLEAKSLQLSRDRFAEEEAADKASFDRRRAQLEEEARLGGNVADRLEKLAKEEAKAQSDAIKDRLELREKEIRLKEKLANVGASAEQKAINEQRAALEIQKAQRVERQALQSITDVDTEKLKAQTAEMVKQLQLLKDQSGEKKKQLGFDTQLGTVSGVDSLNDNTGGFGVSRKERDREIKRLESEIGTNQGILNSRANAAAGGSTFGRKRSEIEAQASTTDQAPVVPADPKLLTALTDLTQAITSSASEDMPIRGGKTARLPGMY